MNLSFTSPIHYISNGSLYGFSPEQMIEEWCSIESKSEGADLNAITIVKNNLLNYLKKNDKSQLDVTCGHPSKLGRCKLNTLPDIFHLVEFKNLKKLIISDTTLTKLPESICQLKALEILNLSNNELATLPELIGQLQALQSLSLSNNKLATLPESFSQLQALQSLGLSRNKLTALPELIGQLQELTNLDIPRNELTTLPESFGQLQLQSLSLLHNKLRALPESFGQLPLRTLDLSNNELTGLSESFGQLQRLERLYLSNNADLTSLPTEILSLPSGCSVNLENCASLSNQVLSNLREATTAIGYQGPTFHFSINEITVDDEEKSVEDMLEELYKIVGKPYQELENVPNNDSLKSWLSRLSYMSDFKASPKVKRGLVTNILNYIALAEKDKEFCDSFNVIIGGAAETCGDRMALSIVHLGLASKRIMIDPKNMKRLAKFLTRGVFAVSMLSDIAAKKISELKFVDEIEVYLGFLVELKSRLKLSIDIEGMLYFQTSSLTTKDVDNAFLLVDKALKDENKVANFLINDVTWRNALKQNYSEDYENAQNPVMEIGEDNPEFWNLYAAKINESLIALTKKSIA